MPARSGYRSNQLQFLLLSLPPIQQSTTSANSNSLASSHLNLGHIASLLSFHFHHFNALFLHLPNARNIIESVKRDQHCALPEKHPPLDEIRQGLCKLILHVRARRDREHEIQLLQRALLCFGDEEEDHHQCHNIKPSIKPKSPHNTELQEQGRERDAQHTAPEETRRDRPCHADLAVRQREHLG
jgi:hypothetical protein